MFGVNRTLATVAAIIFGIGLLWVAADTTLSSIRRNAAAQRDVIWERKLREAEQQHAAEKKELQDSIDKAAAIARAESSLDAVAAASRALALEAELSALKSDPVFPQSLIRELRR